jgi:hypothetical protein
LIANRRKVNVGDNLSQKTQTYKIGRLNVNLAREILIREGPIWQLGGSLGLEAHHIGLEAHHIGLEAHHIGLQAAFNQVLCLGRVAERWVEKEGVEIASCDCKKVTSDL